VRGRSIAALMAVVVWAGPALAGSSGASAWDGAACTSDADCRSARCAAQWSGERYCTRRELTCAYPGSSGVKAGFTFSRAGVAHVCLPGGEWRSSQRAPARKPAQRAPKAAPALARTALNAPTDLLHPPKP